MTCPYLDRILGELAEVGRIRILGETVAFVIMNPNMK